MKPTNTYSCVSCDFYDILEIFAMRKNQVQVTYTSPDGKEHVLITFIKTLITRNKEEFILTLSDMEIRLDRIINIEKVVNH